MTDHIEPVSEFAPRRMSFEEKKFLLDRERAVQQPIDTMEQQIMDIVAHDRQATDVEAVANWMNKLRHLDLRAVITGMFGDTMPKDLNEAIDKAAEWAEKTAYPKVTS